jgi:hypothetical protein
VIHDGSVGIDEVQSDYRRFAGHRQQADRQSECEQIWQSIQSLGKAAEPAKSKVDKKAKAGARAAKGTPAKGTQG